MTDQTGPASTPDGTDDAPGSSGGVCAFCGRARPGQSYHYYYGWKLDPAAAAAPPPDAKVAGSRTRYRIGGNESYFLCKSCVQRLNRLANIGTLLALIPVGLFLTGFGIYTLIPLLSNGSNTWWQPLTCAFCPGALLFLAGIPTIRSMIDVGKAEGEKAAIRLARHNKLHGPETVYWITKEFEKLK
ncbi:MAG TPA: hypothetical protein VMC09_15250 [Anaerolineales bacterium]|nr:hypothetical protein [Anaerolineales bacterium]